MKQHDAREAQRFNPYILLIVSSAFMGIVSAADDPPFSLPGFTELDPEIATASPHSIRYSDRGQIREVPRGVFHYTETEQNFDGGFKVPDPGEELDPMRMITELMQTASKAGTKRNTMSGIYVPMPFGMRPLNLQVSESGGNDLSFIDEAHPPTKDGLRRSPPKKPGLETLIMSDSTRKSLETARTACITEDPERCDEALEKYFRARFGHSPMEKTLKRAEATPDDPTQIAQTELASWLVPSLRESLDNMRSDASTETGNEIEKNEVRRSPRSRKRRRDIPRRSQERTRPHSHPSGQSRVSKLMMIPRWT